MATLTNRVAAAAATLANTAANLVSQLLLGENSDRLLMENGDFFMLEQSVASGATLTNLTAH